MESGTSGVGEIMSQSVSLSNFNSLEIDDAAAILSAVCSSSRWVSLMLKSMPYEGESQLLEVAQLSWNSLGDEDYLEAFAGHPQIGDLTALRDRLGSLAVKEQGQVAEASEATLEELAELNATYLQRFGFIFIIAAKGLSAEAMLEQLRLSVTGSQASELLRASQEQAKIIQNRLITWTP